MTELLALLSKLPPELVAAIVDLVRAVVTSDDPTRTAERHAKVIAARAASQAALGKVLP